MYKIYLAGPITGLTYGDAESWRHYVDTQSCFGLTMLDPLRGKEFLDDDRVIDEKVYNMKRTVLTDEFIGTRDAWDVSRADAIFINLLGADKISVGTVLELGMGYAWGKPLFVCIEDEGNPHDHCMSRCYTDLRFNDLDQGIHALNAFFSV